MDMINVRVDKPKGKSNNQTIDIRQVIRNITGVETDEDKKSVLQKLLEPKEIDNSEKDARKALRIAKRIARGEAVTPEEKQFLMKVDPRLAQMAELARKEGERIKHALQQAESKEEQQNIIQQAYQQVSEVTKKNPQFGMLLGEAVKAAIQEAKEEPHVMKQDEENQIGDDGQPLDKNEKKIPNPAEERQDEMMEQFYPDEWVSVLDCKG